MGKIISYIAMSLNGKIAKADGNVAWLDSISNPDKLDYGYFDFYATVDTTLMGNKTYQLLRSWDIDFPYPDKENYVVTRNPTLEDNEDVKFIKSNHLEFIKTLKTKSEKDLWLIGGGEINTMILNAGLLDEIIVHTMPIILDKGIELFGSFPQVRMLKLLGHKSYPTGVTESVYKVIP